MNKLHSVKGNITSFGSSVKDTITHHKEFSGDDELIKQYRDDIVVSRKGLKYISSQTSHLAKNYWPGLLVRNQKITELFIQLIGSQSLQFEGMEKLYHEFDMILATHEIPTIHPKERQVVVEGVNEELNNYYHSLEQLKWKVINEWQLHSKSVQIRVDEMAGYLDQTIKLIAKRTKKKNERDKLYHKIDKIQKKRGVLDEKEQSSLNLLDLKYKDADDAFLKLDNKLKTVLPHVLSFLEEFVENITKLLLHQQVQTYKEISTSFSYFTTFYGYLVDSDPEKGYESIINQWEADNTATRLKIESFVSVVQGKNPDLIDTEIEEGDQTLRATKVWKNIGYKVLEKKHKGKPVDPINGIFHEYQVADPMVSYKKFNDPNSFRSETYHPSKLVDFADIHPQPSVAWKIAPPLPPRANMPNPAKPLPLVPASKVTSPLPIMPSKALPSTPIPNHYLERSSSRDSLESVSSQSSNMSSSSSHTLSSISSETALQNASLDLVNRQLKRIYNSAKNDIKAAPISDSISSHDINPPINDVFDKTSTVSYKLLQFNTLFEKILKISESTSVDNKTLEAKYDFVGEEAGDLAFKKGDKIEVVLDFQNVDTLYTTDKSNWYIGIVRDQDEYRIGFVPSTYF